MRVRKRNLPAGWYPDSENRTIDTIQGWIAGKRTVAETGFAGIVPHAGWMFSGSVAATVFEKLKPDADTVVIVGGHLPEGSGILAAREERFSTPLGEVVNDLDFLAAMDDEIAIEEDRYADNTVEIQLPLVKYFMKDAHAVWLRCEHSGKAITLGKVIKKAADATGKTAVVIGSTDLTHYGSGYGFTPLGTGMEAVEWVKNINDKAFIDAMLALKLEEALSISRKDRSACSAGGAAASGSYARELGISKGVLTAYTTSFDVHPSESFVGYAGILFAKN